eukprot:gene23314-24720_t
MALLAAVVIGKIDADKSTRNLLLLGLGIYDDVYLLGSCTFESIALRHGGKQDFVRYRDKHWLSVQEHHDEWTTVWKHVDFFELQFRPGVLSV